MALSNDGAMLRLLQSDKGHHGSCLIDFLKYMRQRTSAKTQVKSPTAREVDRPTNFLCQGQGHKKTPTHLEPKAVPKHTPASAIPQSAIATKSLQELANFQRDAMGTWQCLEGSIEAEAEAEAADPFTPTYKQIKIDCTPITNSIANIATPPIAAKGEIEYAGRVANSQVWKISRDTQAGNRPARAKKVLQTSHSGLSGFAQSTTSAKGAEEIDESLDRIGRSQTRALRLAVNGQLNAIWDSIHQLLRDKISIPLDWREDIIQRLPKARTASTISDTSQPSYNQLLTYIFPRQLPLFYDPLPPHTKERDTSLTAEVDAINKGCHSLCNGQYESALGHFQRRLNRRPLDLRGNIGTAVSWYMLGSYGDAARQLETTLQYYPRNIYALYAKAICDMQSQKHRSCVEVCTKAIIDVNNRETATAKISLPACVAELYQLRCIAHFQLGQLQAASDDYVLGLRCRQLQAYNRAFSIPTLKPRSAKRNSLMASIDIPLLAILSTAAVDCEETEQLPSWLLSTPIPTNTNASKAVWTSEVKKHKSFHALTKLLYQKQPQFPVSTIKRVGTLSQSQVAFLSRTLDLCPGSATSSKGQLLRQQLKPHSTDYASKRIFSRQLEQIQDANNNTKFLQTSQLDPTQYTLPVGPKGNRLHLERKLLRSPNMKAVATVKPSLQTNHQEQPSVLQRKFILPKAPRQGKKKGKEKEKAQKEDDKKNEPNEDAGRSLEEAKEHAEDESQEAVEVDLEDAIREMLHVEESKARIQAVSVIPKKAKADDGDKYEEMLERLSALKKELHKLNPAEAKARLHELSSSHTSSREGALESGDLQTIKDGLWKVAFVAESDRKIPFL